MKPANKQFLDENLHHFTTLERAFYVRGLMASIRDSMLRVMQEEFNPGYSFCGTCDTDVADALRLLYRSYHDWLKQEKADTKQYTDMTEGILEMNKIIVKAAFPSNKKLKVNGKVNI